MVILITYVWPTTVRDNATILEELKMAVNRKSPFNVPSLHIY